MIDQRRRITPLKRSSPGQRITARMWNAPIDAINRIAAGVEPPRQRAFRKSGDAVPAAVRTGLWGCSAHTGDASRSLIFEIDPVTMCIKRRTDERAPSIYPGGMGGDRNVGWHVERAYRKLWKIVGSVWCVGRHIDLPSVADNEVPADVGGTSTVIWYLSKILTPSGPKGRIYRLDPETFETVTSFDPPYANTAGVAGIGGNENVLWYTDWRNRGIYQLNPTTGAVIQEYDRPDTRTPSSIGGNETTIYYCSVDEADPDAASILYRLEPGPGGAVAVRAEQAYGLLNITGIGG